jgi:hypothetical protein
VTGSSASSSGRDGRGGVGVSCGCCGDIGGARASQGDEGKSWEQWQHEVTGGDFLRPLLIGTWCRGQGVGERCVRRYRARTRRAWACRGWAWCSACEQWQQVVPVLTN